MRRLAGRGSRLRAAMLALACLIAPLATHAQTYPDRTVTVIVPFAPGGAADTTGRIMADAMAKHLGQKLVVENVAGAGGSTGSARGKSASPTATPSASATWARTPRPSP